MSEPMGIDMPEFQLRKDRREYLREHGTLAERVNKAGKMVYEKPLTPTSIIDDDGTIIYLGSDEVCRREKGMCTIEQTPQWILRAIMQHARGYFNQRDSAVWPESVWNVQYGIRSVFSLNKVDDNVMPLKLRKMLMNEGAPLISRFLIRENPEYGETHFIGIRRHPIKQIDETEDFEQLSIVEAKKEKIPLCTLDDYLFPELRHLTANAITAPEGAIQDGDE